MKKYANKQTRAERVEANGVRRALYMSLGLDLRRRKNAPLIPLRRKAHRNTAKFYSSFFTKKRNPKRGPEDYVRGVLNGDVLRLLAGTTVTR
jgi:hypothetical protein